MKRLSVWLLLVWYMIPAIQAADTLGQEIPEGTVTRMECMLTNKSKGSDAFAGTSEDPKKSKNKGPFHYDVYLPEGYYAKKDRRYPAIFIASPGGNAKMGKMAERIKRDKWIAIMLVESKNGSPDWLSNFLAAYDDAIKRFRIIDNMIVGTGMSGGARCCSYWPGSRPGFKAVVLQSAGFYTAISRVKWLGKHPEILVYGTFGKTDMNLYESIGIRKQLPAGTMRNITVFDGGHTWCSSDDFNWAMDWIERIIFIEAKRDKKMDEAQKWYFKNQVALLRQADTEFAKYELMECLLLLAKKFKIGTSPKAKEKLAQWREQVKQLKGGDKIKKELAARKAYLKVRDQEEALFCGGNKKTKRKKSRKPKNKKNQANSPLQQMAGLYSKIVEKFADTTYGKMADIRAKSLGLEATAKPRR